MHRVGTLVLFGLAAAMTVSDVTGGSVLQHGHAVLRPVWRVETEWPWLSTPAVFAGSMYLMVNHSRLTQLGLRDGQIRREIALRQDGVYETPQFDSAGTLFA
jgi:hypothetical protein